MFENYMQSGNRNSPSENRQDKYKTKIARLKQQIREYVHENAALLDELEETQVEVIIRKEERKFLLRRLCQYEPQTEAQVQANARGSGAGSSAMQPLDSKKLKRRLNREADQDRKAIKVRKQTTKLRKKLVQPIPLDSTGRPVFPIELGHLTIHSLGEVIFDRNEFHCEDAIYPVGYVSTRIYGSLKEPSVKCMYTCKISDSNGMPRFEIASDDSCAPIVGATPDVCHSLLLQKINEVLCLNVVSIKPRGHEFFGLNHPTVLNLIQSSPGTRKCVHYKWCKFEVSRNGDQYCEDADAALNYDCLMRSIDYCKYKMAPDVLQAPSNSFYDGKDNLREYFG